MHVHYVPLVLIGGFTEVIISQFPCYIIVMHVKYADFAFANRNSVSFIGCVALDKIVYE